jgi:RimJ/RimL family protein N-acetyltransferase
MKIFIETERLILRELLPADADEMFEMDSDPEVHKYLGKKPVTDIAQIRDVIQFVRQQYIDNGIGRWAMVDKNTNAFLGWTGLKLMKEPTEGYDTYYDLGYRLLRKYWDKGFATESAIAAARYGFKTMNLAEINGQVELGNTASQRVLEKTGLKKVDVRNFYGEPHHWLSLKREDWKNL